MEHRHRWKCWHDTTLVCERSCNVAIDIKDLIANERADAAQESKLKLLSEQLFAKDLKKPAHDKAYIYLRLHNQEVDKQAVLL